MTLPRSCRLAAGLLLALLLTACVGDLAHLVTLQKSLLAEYPGTEITVSVNDRSSVQVSMVNGVAADLSEERQAELAHAVGRLVIEQYPRALMLQRIAISFGAAERAGPLALTRDRHRFEFTPEQLRSPAAPQVELVDNAPATAGTY